MKNRIFLTWLIVFTANIAMAQFNGRPDSTFGANGVVLFDHYGFDQTIKKAAYGQDGKLYTAGHHIFNNNTVIYLSRFNENGTNDPTFGTNGMVIFAPTQASTNYIADLKITSDNKIIICGFLFVDNNVKTQQFVARFNKDGSLDKTYNQSGIVYNGGPDTDQWYKCWLHDDGKVTAIGQSGALNNYDMVIARYNDNGTLDNTFGNQGIKTFNYANYNGFRDIYFHNNNYYLITRSGTTDYIMALDISGNLRSTFGNNGRVNMSTIPDYGLYLNAIKVYNDNIFVTGIAFNQIQQNKWDVYVAKLNMDGLFATNFGINGYFRSGIGSGDKINSNDFVILPDGSFLGTGSTQHDANQTIEMMSYLLASDGSLYSSYGMNGMITYKSSDNENSESNGICIDKDSGYTLFGTVSATGHADGMIVKLKNNQPGNVSLSTVRNSSIVFKLYPNPVDDNLFIELMSPKVNSLLIEISSLNGTIVQTKQLDINSSGFEQINISDMAVELSSGIYFITIKSEHSKICRKLVKN
jgi:uncharacterized delta-60 repeat protein